MVSKIQRVKNSDLLNKLNKIATSKKMLNVGFLQKEISKIAIINEYGAKVPVTDKTRALFNKYGFHLKDSTKFINIPPRPFMQRTATENENKWADIIDKLIVKYQYDVDKVLHVFGEIVEGAIREMIEDGEFQANHPLTIKIKGGAGKPLVHTGKMSKSVAYEVV